jgi:hypothetical protein
MRWAGHVTRMGRRVIYIENICEKARRKETTRKIKNEWVDLREVEWADMN